MQLNAQMMQMNNATQAVDFAESSNRKPGILALGEALLAQAVTDYIEAIRINDQFHIINLEAFFLSRWGQELSFNQGEIIIRNCWRIAKEDGKI